MSNVPGASALPDDGPASMSFTEQEQELVASTARWLRRLAASMLALGALLVLLIVVGLVLGGHRRLATTRGAITYLMVTTRTMILLVGAGCLWRTWRGLHGATRGSREHGLSAGFLGLGLFYLLLGLFGVMGLATTLLKLAGVS